MMKKRISGLILFSIMIIFSSASFLYAHCEIPCGIYHDNLRIELLREHIQTIEKSMNQAVELSKADAVNYNQLVRWIHNKDEHANKIQEIVTQYFMTQRIKPAAATDDAVNTEYLSKLTLLHEMLVYAMKCKQTTDPENAQKLTELVDKFYNAYFGEADKKHLEEHKQ
jgi:nickel superoxide dismutase